jgi:DNA-binding MarR family transcriptional regulator
MYMQLMYIHTIMSRKPQSPKTLQSDARNAVDTCAGWNIRSAARRISQFLEIRLQAANLSFAQFGLMAEIAAASDDSISALATRMGLDQSTLSRTLRTLEAEGLVEIAVAEIDQRRKLVWLTEKGARRLETALAVWRKANAELERLLSVDLVRRLALETEALAEDR